MGGIMNQSRVGLHLLYTFFLSGSRCNSSTTRSSVTLSRRNTEESYRYWCVFTGIELNWNITHRKVKYNHVLMVILQDEECLRPGDATDLTFLERLEEKMGNHPHFVT